jgi:GMP synthase (glutamine-hydrolysing)
MHGPRLALLNAAHDPADTRRNFRREVPATLTEFHVQSGALPPDTDFDGFVLTGSKSAAYEDTDWIRETEAWAREAIDAGLPALGVCFGHQLLAQALGGTVEDMGEYELGYRTMEHEPDPLFKGIDREFLAFATHSDRVVELPAGASRIASNDYGVQGFRLGSTVGVQFHPEYDLETAARIADEKDVPPEQHERATASVTPENRERAAQAALVFENFVAAVEAATPVE